MAITQRGSVTTGETTGNGSSLTIVKPTGVVSGDVLFAFLSTNNGTITEPSGWVQIYEQTSGVNAFQGSAYYKIAGGSEPASYDWSNSSSSGPMTGMILALIGVDGTTPVDLSTNYAVAGLGSSSEALTTPTVSGNTEDAGRILYVRHTRDASSTGPNSYTESTAGITELAEEHVASGSGSIHYGVGLFWADADFSSGGSKSGLAVTAATAETDNVHSTIVVSATGGGGVVNAAAGLASASAGANSITATGDLEGAVENELVADFEIYVDWDNDSGLNFGNFEISVDDWAATDDGTVVELSDEQNHIGNMNSLKVTWDGSAGQDVWKLKSCESGRAYTFSGWVYVPSGSETVRLEVDGVATGTASTLFDQWEKLSLQFTATGSTHVFRMEPTATPVSGDIVYFDQVQVITDGEDVTGRVLGLRTPLELSYGRDTPRSLNEISPGETNMTLDNSSLEYSPDNTGSPLYGLVKPGRPCIIRATYNGKTHTLFNGFLDDFVLSPSRTDHSLEVSALDLLQKFNEATISTPLYHSIQTGQAVHYILDALGWPSDRRDIDAGATTIRWWWEEQTDAFEALNKVTNSEGPPAFAFISSAGDFVFRDRHHRLLNTESTTSQATFISGSPDKIEFVAAGDVFTSTSAGTSYTLNKPAGVRTNDLLVAFVACDSVSTVTAPAGWTVTRSTTLDDGTDDLGLYVLVKDVESTDGTSWAGTISVSTSRRFARVLAYRGTAPASDCWVAQNSNTSTGTGVTIATPSVSNTSSGAWAVACFLAHENETNTGWGSYTLGATERFDHEVGTTDPVLDIGAADSGAPVSAESGKTMSATLAGTSAVDSSASWIGILRPWEGTGLYFGEESFEYDIGWKDLINDVTFTVEEREPTFKQVVWESEDTYVIDAGKTHEVTVEGDEPFFRAAIPVEDVDYILDQGAVSIALSRDSGQSTTILITATTNAIVRELKLKATPIPVAREVLVNAKDQTSINDHGLHAPEEFEAAWVAQPDAEAVAKVIVGLRAQRLPLITFRISNTSVAKMDQILKRDLSDRIHVIEHNTFTDHDFYIERIEQSIDDVGWNHSAMFGCERAPDVVAGVFTFGTAGAGFDQGSLGSLGSNNDPSSVIILGSGRLDEKVLGL